jgi:phage/plasmid-associated DNA primase
LSQGKGDAGKPSPELIALIGKLLVFFDEPDKSEMLYSGLLKILTGKDSMFARDLYQKGDSVVKFYCTALAILVCNMEPKLKEEDEALWNRIRVIEFESKFVPLEECASTFEQQVFDKKFPIDYDFVNQVKNLTTPLFLYLINHWKLTGGKLLETPECVKIATQSYKTNLNLVVVFLREYVTSDASSSILFQEFNREFSEFCSNLSYRVAVMSKSKLIEEIKKAGLEIDNDVIKGVRFL